jgi:hypothetical protein
MRCPCGPTVALPKCLNLSRMSSESSTPIRDSKGAIALRKITPFLWFNDNAEEAVNFYVRALVADRADLDIAGLQRAYDGP